MQLTKTSAELDRYSGHSDTLEEVAMIAKTWIHRRGLLDYTYGSFGVYTSRNAGI